MKPTPGHTLITQLKLETICLITSTRKMANSFHSSTLLVLVIVTLTSMCATDFSVDARHLLETTLPELPKPELPSLPELPKPELPSFPKVELPKPELPQLPKMELPPMPHVPTLPKPELPHFPEMPHMPELPELPKPVLPALPKDIHVPTIPFPHSNTP